MIKNKNQFLIILVTVIFIIFVMVSYYLINKVIYSKDEFEDLSMVVKNKEYLIKNIYFDGKYLSNSIISNINVDELINEKQTKSDRYSKELESFFKTSFTLSNITIFNKDLKEVANYYKLNEKVDISSNSLKKFMNSKEDELLSSIYLNKNKEKIQIPYLPKVAYLKKIYKDSVLNGVLVLEYDLNYRMKNFYNNPKYNFILLDSNGEVLYHYDDLKSWTQFVKRNSSFKDDFKDYQRDILTSEFFKTENFQSNRLNIKIENGLILITTLKKDYLEKIENEEFKKVISFFLIFTIVTVIILIFVLMILERTSKSLLKIKTLSNDLKNVQKFTDSAQKIAQIGLWKVDLYNNLTWNEIMYSILEINNNNGKISYDTFISYIHPDDKEKFDTEYRYSKNKTKESYLTYRIITNSGKIKWVEQRWKHYYNKNNKFLYTIGSLYDITNRKNIEDLLEMESKDLRDRIDSLPIGIVLIDLDLDIKFFNKTFEKLLGYGKKEIFKKQSFGNFLGEDKELFNLLVVDMHDKKFVDNHEIRFVSNSSEIITASVSLKYNPSAKEILITINDVTTKVREHEKFLINQSRLANLGEMLIDLTYQWRQPLSIISTSASFLKLEHEINAQQREETIDVLGKIIQSSTALSNTIDDFRYYVEEKNEESTFGVNNSIEKVLVILDSQLYENEIEVITDFDEDIELKNLENSFMQVLVSIIKNSIEALSSYPKQKKIIIISTSILKDKLEINITDNAHGIDEKIMPMIFNEFFTTKTDMKSTGLGLYLAKKIVSSKLKGSIIATNKNFNYKKVNYKGVCFTISISLLK